MISPMVVAQTLRFAGRDSMLEDEVKSQIDALLASYKATKDEISRRSALQWTAVGAYLVFLIGAFKAELDVNDWRTVALALSSWPVSILTYAFYIRENMEILRLSDTIILRIERRLRELTDLRTEDPLLGEREDTRGIHRITGPLQRLSDWSVFLGGPLAITGLCIFERSVCGLHITVHLSVTTFIIAQTYLLARYSSG
jgi:hypothetical protein